MLALLDPSQLLLCKGVTLTALPLLQHLFQHYADSSSKHGVGPFTGAQPHTSAWGGHRGTGNSAELARGAGFGRQVLLCQGENSSWPGEHHGPVPGVSPWLSGAALCPRGVVGRTLLTHPACQHPHGQTSFSQPQWEEPRLIQDAKGATCSVTAEAPWHLWGSRPPRQGEEQCVPQASPITCMDSVTRYLRAQQHRGPLSAATSPLRIPTLGTATGCQRREMPGTGSRTQGLCSPPVTWGTSSPTPGPPKQGMELGTAEEEQPHSWGIACS